MLAFVKRRSFVVFIALLLIALLDLLLRRLAEYRAGRLELAAARA